MEATGWDHLKRPRVGVLVVAAVGLLALSPHAVAATWTISTTVDAPDLTPGDGVCDTGIGACSLRAAIQEANALPGEDTVVAPSGTYLLTLPGNDDTAEAGDLDILDSLVLQGEGVGATILDPGRSDRAIDVVFGTVAISGMTVQNGLSTEDGGGIRIQRGTTVLRDIHIQSCEASRGGGIAVLAGNVTLEDCALTNNRAGAGGGGHFGGSVTMLRCQVLDNSVDVPSASGAGLFTHGDLVVRASTIARNGGLGGLGGGVFMSSARSARLEECTIESNRSHEGAGLAASNSSVIIDRTTITDNTASGPGGGAYLVGTTVFVAQNSTISVNRAGNIGLEGGGGVYVTSGARVEMTHCTVTFNNGTPGGGLFLLGRSASIGRTIIANNLSSTAGHDFVGTLSSTGYNLIEDATPGTIDGDVSGNITGVDPALDQLRDNGGPTRTHAILAGSPALDHIPPELCLDSSGVLLTTDQRGYQRPADADGDGASLCDIGSFERDSDCGPDSDGDTLGDICDCAPADATALLLPPECDLRVIRGVSAGLDIVRWLDVSAIAGSGVVYDVSSDAISTMALRGAADGPCVDRALVLTDWSESRPTPLSGWYYLVRAMNACGPGVSEGWGSDSMGRSRPACP